MLNPPRTLRGRLHILACPACRGELHEESEALACPACRCAYPVKNEKIYFATPPVHQTQASELKHRLRRLLGPYYKPTVRIFGPGFPRNARKLLLATINPGSNAVVDLGSGTERMHPDVITLDLFDYPEVDIVCDLEKLPFGAGKVDAFVTASVLEHIEDVPTLLEKIFVSTRAGGVGIHSFPFLFPFHESPHDFVRYTHIGARSLFKKWTIRRLFNAAGPITLLNATAVEFVSTLLSFGNGRTKEAIYLLLCLVVFPFKFLDMLFVDRPQFLSISSILCIIVEKPLDGRL